MEPNEPIEASNKVVVKRQYYYIPAPPPPPPPPPAQPAAPAAPRPPSPPSSHTHSGGDHSDENHS